MRKVIKALAFSILLFSASESFADDYRPVYDTCCAPDSLQVISKIYPVFCVSWQVHVDSVCPTPIEYEIQWKLLLGAVWTSKIVTYTSGTLINFCYTLLGCGTHVWRVRTRCGSNNYSDWVNGPKFTPICDHDDPDGFTRVKVSPNPAVNSITLSGNKFSPGPVIITIDNLSQRRYFTKPINIQKDGVLKYTVSVGNLTKGMYVIAVIRNNVVIAQRKFLKSE
jgi:hypothetical protein